MPCRLLVMRLQSAQTAAITSNHSLYFFFSSLSHERLPLLAQRPLFLPSPNIERYMYVCTWKEIPLPAQVLHKLCIYIHRGTSIRCIGVFWEGPARHHLIPCFLHAHLYPPIGHSPFVGFVQELITFLATVFLLANDPVSLWSASSGGRSS